MVRYETKDGELHGMRLRLAGFEDADHIRRAFQGVRDYARKFC